MKIQLPPPITSKKYKIKNKRLRQTRDKMASTSKLKLDADAYKNGAMNFEGNNA